MHRHIIYIINPIAGTRTKKDLQPFIEQKTKEKGIPFTVFPSVASGDYSFLDDIIKENKTTDVVIAGGDGTFSQAAGNLLNINLNFGIVPCGSGNGLAYAAKIPKQVSKALDIIFNGKALLIDGFTINDHFSCMLCGLGFDAKVAHDFAEQPKRGLITYIKMVVKNYFSATTHPFEIKLADQSFKTEAYFISIANSNQFGNNFTIAPRASLSDGLLDIVIAGKASRLNFLVNVLRQVRKGKITQEGVMKKGMQYFHTKKIKIYN
jgi:YegS/Rv2252/BmrU family lipid kinase